MIPLAEARVRLPQAVDGAAFVNMATGNVIGAPLVVHKFSIADAAGDTDIVLTHKERVLDVSVTKTGGAGGAGDTVQVKNTATAITDAFSLNVADKTVVRPGTIDDASYEIAAGGTLRVTIVDGNAGATDLSCQVYVICARVA
jgi:hypothetical protein